MANNLAFGFMIASFCFCFFCMGFTLGQKYRKKLSENEIRALIREEILNLKFVDNG